MNGICFTFIWTDYLTSTCIQQIVFSYLMSIFNTKLKSNRYFFIIRSPFFLSYLDDIDCKEKTQIKCICSFTSFARKRQTIKLCLHFDKRIQTAWLVIRNNVYIYCQQNTNTRKKKRTPIFLKTITTIIKLQNSDHCIPI